jgi:hypothetical protein
MMSTNDTTRYIISALRGPQSTRRYWMCWTVVQHEQRSVELLVSLFAEWRSVPWLNSQRHIR